MMYTGMIDKYAPEIMKLRDMESNRAEMRAGLIVMKIMDDTMKEVKEKIGNLYSELIIKQPMKQLFYSVLVALEKVGDIAYNIGSNKERGYCV